MLTVPTHAFCRDDLALARSIISIALSGLPQMLDDNEQVFCFRLKKSKTGNLSRESVSQRYTVMTMLGLLKAEAAGYTISVDKGPILKNLFSDVSWAHGVGDIGLLFWLCSNVDPDRLPALFRSLGGSSILHKFPDAREGRTMELAWLLTGLSLSVHVGFRSQGVVDLAVSVREHLSLNQANTGLFSHLYAAGTLLGKVRARIGSFADQVYPIYALTQYAAALDAHGALDDALRCGETICNCQGPLGQWWWHYDSSSGKVVGRYPVYSVHQDGMAPMALFALQEATGNEFSEPIRKGIAWVAGQNELGRDIRDLSSNVVWRNIRLPKYLKYFDEISNSLLGYDRFLTEPCFKTTYECRPYELGWALFALAGSIPHNFAA